MDADARAWVQRDPAYYRERREAKRRAARTRRRVALLAASVAVVAAVAIGAGFAGSADRIAAGVTIAGVDVGGLTAQEAVALLEQESARIEGQPIVLVHDGESFSVDARAVGAAIDWETAVDQAVGAGGGFLLFRGYARLKLRLFGSDLAAAVGVDPSRVDGELNRIAAAVDRAPREAAIELDGLRPVIVEARAGVELDRAGTRELLLGALVSLERAEPLPLPVRVAEPSVRAADLEAVAAQVRTALSGPVTLTYKKQTLTLRPKKLAQLLELPHDGSRELAVGGEAAAAYVAGLAEKLDRAPRDASFMTVPGGVELVPALAGRKLDGEAASRDLLAAALESPVAEREATLTVALSEPKVTTEQAQAMGITGIVSSYTTTYGGDPNRIHNVQLVSRLIDDHFIAPGETFSFNETTGERNAGKGFLEAPVILNGELETGIGGGVCQVSTTVFNAAYEAGLPIGTRTNHALYISHYPTGRDATVDYPGTDLTFTNDTGHWLWLRAFVDAGALTINLYGTPTDREVVTEQTPLRTVERRPIEYIDDPDLFVGERVLEEPGAPAREVSVRRIVYDGDGNVLFDTTWYSSYRAEAKIVRVGTKPVPAPEPVEEPAPADAKKNGSKDAVDEVVEPVA